MVTLVLSQQAFDCIAVAVALRACRNSVQAEHLSQHVLAREWMPWPTFPDPEAMSIVMLVFLCRPH